jgi:hypothetical protein
MQTEIRAAEESPMQTEATMTLDAEAGPGSRPQAAWRSSADNAHTTVTRSVPPGGVYRSMRAMLRCYVSLAYTAPTSDVGSGAADEALGLRSINLWR